MTGALVLVATPIGNLSDLSPRAVEALREADVIACEDTRRTRKLLTHSGISRKRLVAVHEHNEAAQVLPVLELVRAGKRVAVVTDAGTPGISDPGERLVAAAVEAGLVVEAVPGPSAVVAALVVSGLPASRFVFEGFLPRKGRERAARLAEIAGESRTTVVYEAPTRVRATVADLVAACGPHRRVAVARELTKVHEETWRGTVAEAAVHLGAVEPRGEYVIVVGPAEAREDAVTDSDIEAALRSSLDAGETTRSAVEAVASALGAPRRRVYELAVGLTRSP